MILHRRVTPGKVVFISMVMTGILAGAILFSLWLGTADIPFSALCRTLLGESTGGTTELIVLKVRLPRVLLAGLVGFALSLGGAVFQALLRNPLAEPFILGVSSGAALGAIIGIMLGFSFQFGIPAFSFAGALVTILLVLLLGTRRMGMESSTILLTGVIINAFFTAVIMFFVSTSTDSRLHTMLFWLYGDLSQSHFGQSALIAPVVILAAVVLYGFGRDLNLMTLGDEAACHMGVDVERTKIHCFLLVSLMTGLVVSLSGLIGFVGLIVPHLARMAFGPDHRLLIPVSAIGGAVLLIVCDTFARWVVSPSELPVGVVTAFLGAPFFMILLRTRGSQWNRS
ncbi:FecCD family ABC transporter permease [Desulfatiglans anilini]|uniref:FecCD family ABC transporter permease n=1 Tax=Desulfatiglans anilini TaxID=90728 RepID=UPI0004020AA3|nr:iron ABC transporter permease [Desulfatiglans anilini]